MKLALNFIVLFLLPFYIAAKDFHGIDITVFDEIAITNWNWHYISNDSSNVTLNISIVSNSDKKLQFKLITVYAIDSLGKKMHQDAKLLVKSTPLQKDSVTTISFPHAFNIAGIKSIIISAVVLYMSDEGRFIKCQKDETTPLTETSLFQRCGTLDMYEQSLVK